jgi:hypothetical protein
LPPRLLPQTGCFLEITIEFAKRVETLIMLTPCRAAAVNQQIFEFFVRKEA